MQYEEWRDTLSSDTKKLVEFLEKKGCWKEEYYRIFGDDAAFMEDIKYYCYPIFAARPEDARWIEKCLRYCHEHMGNLDNDTKQAFCTATGECATSKLSYEAYEKLLDDNIRRGIQVDIQTLRVFYKGNMRVKKDDEILGTVEKVKEQLDEVKEDGVYEKLEETEKKLKDVLRELEKVKADRENEISRVKAVFADKVLECLNERREKDSDETEAVRKENEKLQKEIIRLKEELEQVQMSQSGQDEVTAFPKGVNQFLIKKRFQSADEGNQKRIILHVLLSKKYNASCIRGVTEAIHNGGNLDMLFQLVFDSASNQELLSAVKVFLPESVPREADEPAETVPETGQREIEADSDPGEGEDADVEADFFEAGSEDSEFQDFEY